MSDIVGCIAVIVITYNSEETVIETLESIKAQTYKEIELIVSDDYSQDNTVRIVEQWLRKNGERFVSSMCRISDRNYGTSNNLNRGVELSRSRLYKVIAGDDILLPKALEVYAKYYQKNPGKIGVSEMQLLFDSECDDEFQKNQRQAINRGYSKLKENSIGKKRMYKSLLKENYIPALGVGLIEKNIYKEIGGYDERFILMEDYPFFLKIAQRGYEFYYINEMLVGYRIHKKSVSQAECDGILSTFDRDKMSFFYLNRSKEMLKNGMIISFLGQLYLYKRKEWKSKKRA